MKYYKSKNSEYKLTCELQAVESFFQCWKRYVMYSKNLNSLDTQKITVIILKIEECGFTTQ